jgi:hypothetical protein
MTFLDWSILSAVSALTTNLRPALDTASFTTLEREFLARYSVDLWRSKLYVHVAGQRGSQGMWSIQDIERTFDYAC